MSEASKKKVVDFSLLRRVFFYVKPYRKQFYLSIIMAIVLAFFAPVRPYLIQLTVDRVTRPLGVLHVPEWLRPILVSMDFKNVGQFILNVTIFQVLFLFVETFI